MALVKIISCAKANKNGTHALAVQIIKERRNPLLSILVSILRWKKPFGGNTFFAQADIYLQYLDDSGKYNQWSADKSRVKHFREFIGRDIAFQDITPAMLERFKGWIRGTRQINERSAINALVSIRSVFSMAAKDQVVDPKYHPFGKGKVKIKFPEKH